VYETKPRTTEDLKQIIREEMAAIPPSMLQRVMQNLQKCLRECVNNNGRHLTNTIFKKWILQLKFFEIKLMLAINSLKKIVQFLFHFNLKIVRCFCRTLYFSTLESSPTLHRNLKPQNTYNTECGLHYVHLLCRTKG
jgi:hypothetical protein